ncbi:Fibroblast growth factor receptor-like 1 [Varanus komodoensis]|nr:Fibroblast growth factor receptor-like 1 [Varanus komodoensis]
MGSGGGGGAALRRSRAREAARGVAKKSRPATRDNPAIKMQIHCVLLLAGVFALVDSARALRDLLEHISEGPQVFPSLSSMKGLSEYPRSGEQMISRVVSLDMGWGPPRVADKVIHRQCVRLGRTIKLLCPVEGDPPPLTMWTKDGRTIHSGWTRFRVLQQGLRIKEVESEDAGSYVCKATNGFGSTNVNYTLIVMGE